MALLKNELLNIHKDVEVNTVDQYQGRDKEVIIYSCTKNSDVKVNKLFIFHNIFLNCVYYLRILVY